MPNNASLLLLAESETIMKRWEARASKEVLAALELKSLALRDSLPDLLALIAHVLATAASPSEARRKWEEQEGMRVGQEHGRDRAETLAYTISQMIFEYHILRQVICDVLEEKQPLSTVAREVIVCAIEQAVNAASTQFSATLKQAQDRLAAALTHDLKGPLTVASLATEQILRRPHEASYTTKAATRIASSLQRLTLMVESLLDVSMLEAGKRLNRNVEEFLIGEWVQQLVDDFNLAHGNRFVFASHVTGSVLWDKADICRVLENLCSNAVKYGSEQAPITVTLTQKDDVVTLAVHNEGRPIAAAEHEKLFSPFHRGVKTSRNKGWGIGLSVVKGIAEAHLGEVRLTSSQEKGTTFSVHLPRDPQQKDSREKTAAAQAHVRPARATIGALAASSPSQGL